MRFPFILVKRVGTGPGELVLRKQDLGNRGKNSKFGEMQTWRDLENLEGWSSVLGVG